MKVGWQQRRLEDVATLQRGFDLPTQHRTNGKYPLVSSSGVSDTHDKGAVQGPGVVTGRSGSIGNVFYIDEDFWPLNTVLYVKDFHGNDPRFVYRLLEQFDLKRFASGTGVPTLNRNFVHDELVAVPPRAEQQRIVGILDEAFDRIAAAKANTEKNIQNARAIFESRLQFIFTQGGEGWVKKRLGDVFSIGSSKRVLEREWTSHGVPFYGGREVVKLSQHGVVVSDNYISEEKYHEIAAKYGVPQQGDILMTARGTIGVGYIVKADDKFYYKDGNLMYLHPRVATEPLFVLYAFRSQVIMDQLERLTGTTVTHLPIEKANDLLLMFPNAAVQKQVTEQLQQVENETKCLERLYQRKLESLDALKKSLLHQAFSGQL